MKLNKSMMTTLQKLFMLLLCCTTTVAFSQYTEVINSNRPGVSKSAFSVGKNVVQFELGPYMVKEKHTPSKYEVSGFGVDFSARYGLFFEQLEVNLEGIYQNDTFKDQRSSVTNENKRGNFRNLTLGAKYLVYDPYKKTEEEKPNLYSWHANRKFKWKDLIPAVAAYAGVNYDFKDNPYIPYVAPYLRPNYDGGVSFKAMVSTQHNFSSGWVFVTNFIMDRIGSDFSDFQYILTLTKALNEQIVLFGEAHGISDDYYADNLFRFGGAYLWGRDFQLDGGITFNTKDSPSVFSFNIGASYRLDFHEDPKPDNNNDAEDKMDEIERKMGKKAKRNRKKKNRKRDKDAAPVKEKQSTDFDDE